MEKSFEKILINQNANLLEALTKMDKADGKLLIVTDNKNLFVSLVSIGDIQRAIISNIRLETSIKEIMRLDVQIGREGENFETIKQYMRVHRNEFMPVINAENEIIDVIFWNDLFSEKPVTEKFDLPVVIMAGGKGTRMKPITNIIPKPLIPIGDKSMLELIMERFNNFGSKRFFLSLNFKAEIIQFYLDSISLPYIIESFKEENFYGTAGSLSLMKNKINETFFVSNCDILVDADYADILKYHMENSNELTIVAALKNYDIPYGTLETKESGKLISIQEKPNFTFKINTGVYILEPNLLDEIPEDEFFHITDLMQSLLDQDRKVGVYPISEGSWKDFGTWREYLLNEIN